MSKKILLLVAVFIGAAILTFLLTNLGLNSSALSDNSKPVDDLHDHGSEDIPMIAKSLNKDSLDMVVDSALYYIEKGKQSGDMMLMMQKGVFKLREVESLDTNNERAIYALAKLSIESNQLEKAKNRFKKLILLQPSNQEYQDQYDKYFKD